MIRSIERYEPGRGAILSPCGRYRYRLDRAWDNDCPTIAFIMLNPSTADAMQDDNTIRKCVKFAKRFGYGRLIVGNLYAWRATDPRELDNRGVDVVGPENDMYLRAILRASENVVCAWGTKMPDNWRAHHVRNLIKAASVPAYALRITKDGHPGHPLYIRDDASLIPYPHP